MPGLYIHIPFCKHKCSYCDFTSFPDKLGLQDAYMACLIKEIKLRGEELKKAKGEDYLFDTVYFGGGTPSVIDYKYIGAVIKQLKLSFSVEKDAEITIELNPGTVSAEKIAAYKKYGVNRFSVGLQSAIDSQLEDVGRIHTARDYVYCMSLLKGENVSTDVMLGLKGQTLDDVKKTITLADKCGSSHMSVYALTVEDGTPIYTDYLNGELPDGDEVASMYAGAVELLKNLGYARYEVSNFAKKGKESRHNLNYWRRGEYLGFGVSASSFMFGRRFTNTFNLDEYMKCVLSGFYPVVDNEEVTPADAEFEFIMLAMRTRYGVNLKRFNKLFGYDFTQKYSAQLKKNEVYLTSDGESVRIKDEYLYVQNNILTDFILK